MSTHSPELLYDEGVGLDEEFRLVPEEERTVVRRADSFEPVRALLKGVLSLAEAVIPMTSPRGPEQLSLCGAS